MMNRNTDAGGKCICAKPAIEPLTRSAGVMSPPLFLLVSMQWAASSPGVEKDHNNVGYLPPVNSMALNKATVS